MRAGTNGPAEIGNGCLPFPLCGLNARHVIKKKAFAGVSGNDEVAPRADLLPVKMDRSACPLRVNSGAENRQWILQITIELVLSAFASQRCRF
jgi:hypothetical protein